MGCGASTAPTSPGGRGREDGWGLPEGVPPYVQTINHKSPQILLDTIKQPKDLLALRGEDYEVDIKYCYVSQRGYYPNTTNKANQDSYLVLENILGDKSTHAFGVFDGHGDTGDLCSHFAADVFPRCLAKELKESGGVDVLAGGRMTSVYTSAFVKTNKLLKKSNIDDSLSGTTGITIIMKGDTLYVGNVGDSRAIIATESDSKLVASELSSDQTPFRKDERERLKKKGAVIMTIEQIEGNEEVHENWGAEGDNPDEAGDPPRVWDNSLEKPGCAFTRSIGDSVAERIGVFAEPEVLTWKLQPNDRFAVVASDGVFEFISSQAVVDMVGKFGDPLEACKHVVAEAYRLWLQFDERTDDITMILINFEEIRTISGHAPAALEERQLGTDDARPVRRVMSKTKRKEISENFKTDDENAAEFDVEANSVSKTEEELLRIGQMLKQNFMFQHLEPVQREQIFKVMQLRPVSKGTKVIQEGAAGEEMYIIDAGEFSVFKKDAATGADQLVFTYTNVGASFGELSLMYGKPRAASVVANSDGQLWVIGRQAFRAVLMRKKQQGILKLFQGIPLFKELTLQRMQRLAASASSQTFNDGDVILTSKASKDCPWILLVVQSGGIKLSPLEEDGKDEGSKRSPRKQVRTEGMFLAAVEVGMSFQDAIADGRTKVSCLPATDFEALLGSGAASELRSMVKSKNKGKTKRKLSIFSTPELLAVPKTSSIADLSLEGHVIAIGSFGTIANYKKAGTVVSCKLIAKRPCVDVKMDSRMLLERQVLAALGGSCGCIPKIASVYQDSRQVLLVYEDVFLCTLDVALSNHAVADEHKIYYAACLFSALSALHDAGVFLRFLNTSAIYVTQKGIPKIADLRYCKKMDGSKAFTICGDPLYFAPEIVSQRGYDYGADLWAMGILLYEMFEGINPMGNHDTEETAIFKKIAAFDCDTLDFGKATPKKAKSLIMAFLHKDCNKRLGYESTEEVRGKKAFSDVNWKTIGKDLTLVMELMGHVDAIPDAEILPLEKPCALDEY